MKLEHQVVSLELAQKLKELGVKKESLFWWHDGCSTFSTPHVKQHGGSCIGKPYHAYTSAELGEMLPFTLEVMTPKKLDMVYLHCDKARTWWNISYDYMDTDIFHQCSADTEADARAKMLIYLIENGLVDVKTLTTKDT